MDDALTKIATAILAALVLGSWGYTYRTNGALERKIEEARIEARNAIVGKDSNREAYMQEVRQEMYSVLKELREDMRRNEEKNDAWKASMYAKLESISKEQGDQSGDLKALKVLFSDKGRR